MCCTLVPEIFSGVKFCQHSMARCKRTGNIWFESPLSWILSIKFQTQVVGWRLQYTPFVACPDLTRLGFFNLSNISTRSQITLFIVGTILCIIGFLQILWPLLPRYHNFISPVVTIMSPVIPSVLWVAKVFFTEHHWIRLVTRLINHVSFMLLTITGEMYLAKFLLCNIVYIYMPPPSDNRRQSRPLQQPVFSELDQEELN